MNRLYYGDNLGVLRQHIPRSSVDLVYLDPPFNSNRSYNVLFRSRSGDESQAQIDSFDDTWTWSQQAEAQYDEILEGGIAPAKVADAVQAIRGLVGDNDVMAYIVMMTARLVELHRVLKPTGSLYLHCDPTASHYLKIILDAIFVPTNFRNEIIWRRTGAHSSPRRFETVHDVILFYAKDQANAFFQGLKQPYTREHVESRYERQSDGRLKFVTGGNILTGPGATGGESGAEWRGFDPTAKGRHWAIPGYLAEQMPEGFEDLGTLAKLDALFDAGLVEINDGGAWPLPVKYLEEGDGLWLQDIWAYQPGTAGVLYGTGGGIDQEVQWLGPTSPERLGFQTQKPYGLLRRIIESSCPPGGLVLDPFCGCGTTVAAAQGLGRRWVGIDITYLAIDLIQNRLVGTYGTDIIGTFEVEGIPTDVEGAEALFAANPFDFERWAVSRVGGQPNVRQVGDRGIDGVIRFPINRSTTGRVLISVKGGRTVGPAAVRDLIGTVNSQRAQMGVLITLATPTRGVLEAVRAARSYTYEANGQRFPKIQVVTVSQLLGGHRLDHPTAFRPYMQSQPMGMDEPTLF